ncbi:MAG: efflux RND transporter periplasmic adaptor subunit [Magnetococcales bacterium]|nr:efflux RND transporter periplasmic adaptor subunit [Magnetococcales bacterium]
MSWKRWLILTLLLLSLGAGGWYSWRQRETDEKTRLLTAKVITATIEETTTALGTLQPLNYVDVGTQVSGQLKKIHVALGDTVHAGDLLAEIDPSLLITKVESDRAQLQALEAQLAEKTAQNVLAKAQFARQKTMLAADATSREALQSAESTLKTTAAQMVQIAAQMRQVESSLRANETNLGYTRILAPMNGTVVTLPARQGQTLNATQQAPTLLRIADLTTMTVWTQVSEADISRLKLGMTAWFTTLGRPEKRHYSRLRQILPTPDVVNNVVLYNALFDVENPDQELGIQMSAQVSFVHGAAKDALLVPISALNAGVAEKGSEKRERDKETRKERPNKDQTTVRLLVAGKPENRVVEVGVKNRLQAQILSGLAEGDEVVIASPEKRPGASTSPLLMNRRPTGGGRGR